VSSFACRLAGVGLLLALGPIIPPPKPAEAQAFVPRAVQEAEPEDVAAVRVDAPWELFGVSSARSHITNEAQTMRVAVVEGDRAACVRRLALDAPLSAVLCRFNVSVAAVVSGGSQMLRIGSGFGSSPDDSPDAISYARLALVPDPSGTFQLRDPIGRRNSMSFDGVQAVTWALNNSGRALTYPAPDGTTEAVADDRMDVWVGRSKVFNDIPVTQRGGAISELKWYWGGGSGVTTFDHLTIENLDGMDPAALAAVAEEPPIAEPPAGEALQLYRPTPNPFEKTMRFAYAIPNGIERVDIGVFDVSGRKVRGLVQEPQPVGVYEVAWDGRADGGARVHNGVYFLRASIGTTSRVARVVYLLK
jgi:hypothetical protein